MLVSIIVPIYNAEPFLSKCITSLSKQSHKDIEIILINDGSTDNSFNICKKFSTKDKRIKILNQKNKGQSAARNLGIDIAKGKYIMFVDADDFCELDMVSSLLEVIKMKHIELAICSYTSHLFDGNKELISNQLKMESGYKSAKDLMGLRIVNLSNHQEKISRDYEVASVWGRLYVAEIIEKNHLRFNPFLTKFEDMEFNMVYLSYIDGVFVLDKSLYHYHVGINKQTISDKVTLDWGKMISKSYTKINNAFIGREPNYLNIYYSYIFIGYFIRLFQVGSPVTFSEALSEMKKVSRSIIFKDCMDCYYRSPGSSILFPFFLKLNLFFLAALVAKIRMLKVFYMNKPIRQWCFSK